MYYCGVCKSIGRRYGNLSRFGLVNEMGMLALMLDCIAENAHNMKFNVKGCIAHPWKKSPAVIDSLYCDYAADVNVAFVYFKLLPFIELDHHRAHFSFLIKMNQHGNVFFNSIRHKKSPPEIAYRMHCMVILGVDFT